MMEALLQESNASTTSSAKKEYVVMRLGSQLFCVSVENIEDILMPQDITRIPLAPPEVLGALNLRGRIVTVIDLKERLGIERSESSDKYRNIVMSYGKELYSLVVDDVTEVIMIAGSHITRNPENLSEKWKEISTGVYLFNNELMIILDIKQLLKFADVSEKE